MRLFERPRTLGDHLYQGVAKAFLVGVGLEVAIVAAASMQGAATSDSGAAPWAQVDQPRSPEARLMHRFDCSTEGYDATVVPRSAIVRDDSTGRLDVVSFARGWQVYTSDRAAQTLVAVCRKPQG